MNGRYEFKRQSVDELRFREVEPTAGKLTGRPARGNAEPEIGA